MVIACIVLYALIMVGIAVYSVKRSKNVQDYFLAGRNMGAWMSAFAYGTTYFSAVIFIGYAGKFGWNFGVSAAWIGIGNALIGSYLAWLVLAKRTHHMTRLLNASTMPEFFQKRFGSRNMKIYAALCVFVFMVPYSASVYQGLSYLFESIFNIPFVYGIIGMAALTAVYLLMGGYLATALCDFVQGFIMILGVIAVIASVLSHPNVGGLSEGLSRLSAVRPDLGSLTKTGGQWLALISTILLTSLGSWGLPQMVHKFYTVRNEAAIKRGTIISTVFALVVAGGAYFLGAFGRLFSQSWQAAQNGLPLDPVTGLANADLIMPHMLMTALPEILIGVVLVLVLSASMSTLSSLVLVSSSAISMDLVKGVFFPKMSEKNVLRLMRALCGLFIIASVWIATNRVSGIVALMSLSWGTLSGAFLGPFLYGLYWKRTTRAGAWAGLIGGVAVSMGLTLFIPNSASIAPQIGTIAMLTSLAVVPLVSLMTKPGNEVAQFVGMKDAPEKTA